VRSESGDADTEIGSSQFPPVKKPAPSEQAVVRKGKKVFGIFGGASAKAAAKKSSKIAEDEPSVSGSAISFIAHSC
jgi:hypothetical protein